MFTSVNEAVVSFTAGKTDKATLLSYAKTLSLLDQLTLVSRNVITADEANDLVKVKQQAAPAQRGLYLKVSEKGAMSVYGLQRMPVTLYREQWERLLSDDQVKAMKEFIKTNASKLKLKE